MGHRGPPDSIETEISHEKEVDGKKELDTISVLEGEHEKGSEFAEGHDAGEKKRGIPPGEGEEGEKRDEIECIDHRQSKDPIQSNEIR